MPKARKTTSETYQDSSPSSIDRPREEAGDRERIALRAYELYLSRGRADGRDFDDWLDAERELGSSNGRSTRGDAGE